MTRSQKLGYALGGLAVAAVLAFNFYPDTYDWAAEQAVSIGIALLPLGLIGAWAFLGIITEDRRALRKRVSELRERYEDYLDVPKSIRFDMREGIHACPTCGEVLTRWGPRVSSNDYSSRTKPVKKTDDDSLLLLDLPDRRYADGERVVIWEAISEEEQHRLQEVSLVAAATGGTFCRQCREYFRADGTPVPLPLRAGEQFKKRQAIDKRKETLDRTIDSPSTRHAFVLTEISKNQTIATWDMMCFCAEFLDSHVETYPWLRECGTKKLTKYVHDCHYIFPLSLGLISKDEHARLLVEEEQ